MSTKIKTVILDNDKSNISLLFKSFSLNYPEIKIVGIAKDINDGIKIINRKKPILALIDISMNNGEYLKLLKEVRHTVFDMIFTTIYKDLSNKEFILPSTDIKCRPLYIDDMKNAINLYLKYHQNYILSNRVYNHNLSLNQKQEKIIISTLKGLSFITIEEICRCEADGNYTVIYLINGSRITISKSLRNFSELLLSKNFVRIHNKHLINLKYVKHYIQGRGGYVILENNSQIEVSENKKANLISSIKKYALYV